MEAKERIIQYIGYKKITKNKFCEINLLSNSFFNNDSAIGSDKLLNIFRNHPELNMDWVITGRGEMLIELNILAAQGKLKKIKKFMVKDPVGMMSHELIEMKAVLRMLLRVNGEILSTQRGVDDAATMTELSEGVQDEISLAMAEIQRKYG